MLHNIQFLRMIEELKLEDCDTRMLQEKIQYLELEKKQVVDKIIVCKTLLAERKPNALDKMMAKRKRISIYNVNILKI